MTWSNRLRLLGGLVVVVAVVAAATFHLNGSRARVESTAAQISAESYSVATPYSGLVVEQLVELGDEVVDGQPLFRLDSANLQRDLAMGAVPTRTVETAIDADGYLVVRATGDGTLTALAVEPGTFARESTELATVQRAGSLFVEAQYLLTTDQYARMGATPRATIVLPDRTEVPGEVSDVAVEDQDGEARIVVSVQSDELLAAQAADRLVVAGAPVVVRLHLENDGVVTDVASAVQGRLSSVAEALGRALRGATS